MRFDSRTFRKALGCFPTGVTVATTRAGNGAPVGVTVSSFTSVSLTPPLVLFCLDNRNGSLAAFRAAGHFAVNVLRSDQREVSIRFSSGLEDKWRGFVYDTWETGSPIIPGCLAALECATEAIHEAGDHCILIGRVQRLEHSEAGQPLVYYRGSYADIGRPLP